MILKLKSSILLVSVLVIHVSMNGIDHINIWSLQLYKKTIAKNPNLTKGKLEDLKRICSYISCLDPSNQILRAVQRREINITIQIGKNIKNLESFEVHSFATQVIKEYIPISNGMKFTLLEGEDPYMTLSWGHIIVEKIDILNSKMPRNDKHMTWASVTSSKDIIIFTYLLEIHRKWQHEEVQKAYERMTDTDLKTSRITVKEPEWDRKVASYQDILKNHNRIMKVTNNRDNFLNLCLDLKSPINNENNDELNEEVSIDLESTTSLS